MSKGTKCGFRMLNVETYGGGLWHTWFDRDLSVAGRALLREGDRLVHRLVRIEFRVLGCATPVRLHTLLLSASWTHRACTALSFERCMPWPR